MTPLLCPHRLVSRGEMRDVSRLVVDNVDYAWRNADDESRCYTQLNSDFVHDYRADLDKAATQVNETGTSLFGQVLAEVWTERFAAVDTALLIAKVAGVMPMDFSAPPLALVWGSDDEVQHRPHQPTDETYWSVWDEAAHRLDPEDVVRAAGLDDVLDAEYAD